MITGDSKTVADSGTIEEFGVDEVLPRVLPADKDSDSEALCSRAAKRVAMVGDGACEQKRRRLANNEDVRNRNWRRTDVRGLSRREESSCVAIPRDVVRKAIGVNPEANYRTG